MEGIVVGGLLMSLLFGAGAGSIANAKGRSFIGYFLLGFVFSIVGLLIAIGMPSLAQSARNSSSKTQEGNETALQVKPDQAEGASDPEKDNQEASVRMLLTKEAAIHYVANGLGIPRIFSKADVGALPDAFKIFLADHYAVRRQEALAKFIFADKLFDDVESALKAARDLYAVTMEPIRLIEDSDWEQTRRNIEEGKYISGGDVGVIAVQRMVRGTIALRSDGAFEVIANSKDGEVRRFAPTLSAAEELLAKQNLVNQSAPSDRASEGTHKKSRRNALAFAISFSGLVVVCAGFWITVGDISPRVEETETQSESARVAVNKIKEYFAGNFPNPNALAYGRILVRKRSNRRWDNIDWKELYCVIGVVEEKKSVYNSHDRPFFAVIGFGERANSEMLLTIPLAFPGAATYEVVTALLHKECP